MQWYFSKGGAQQGPVSTDELRAKISSGEVSANDLVWKEGMADWTPSSKVAELAISAAAAPSVAPAPPVSTTPTPYQPSAYTPPAVAGMDVAGGLPAAAAGKAKQSQILGIVGIVLAILCGCLGGLPCGILAIVFGNQYKKMAAASGVEGPDFSKAKAGILMGWIAIVLAIIMTVVGVFINLATQKTLGEQMRIEMEKARQQQERTLEQSR